MSRAIVFCLAAALLFPSSAALQTAETAQVPPLGLAKPNSGMSTIRGHVFAADTGQPLRKAIVRIASGELRENRIATTDVDGQYEFKDLPAGRYQLNASKGSFVGLAYGQTRPMQPGMPLEVRANQTIEKVDFALPRGGVITGRVLDEYGEPVADTRVMVMRYQYMQGRRRLTPAGRMSTTNDIGEFRLFGLSPGQYFLSATITNAMGLGAAGADTDDRSGYAPTYFPGTPNVAEAQRVAVDVGNMITDVNIALVPTRTSRISGSAFDADGKPMTRGNVVIMQRVGVAFTSSAGVSLRPDGTFTLAGVAPGEYTLRAMGPPMGPPGAPPDVATATVTISGEDVTGLRLTVTRPVLVTGRIVVDPVAAQSLKPSTIRVNAILANPDDAMLNGGMSMPGVVKDDFTFEFRAQPGRTIVRANVMGPGWTARAVRLNGIDITDEGMDIKAGEDTGGVEIELTNRLSEISGAVTDSRGTPTRDYTVVVFARDAERWGFASRYVSMARPDQDGRFKVRGLPAAEYLIAAVQSVEPGETSDPEFLEKLRDSATPLTLGDGETKTVDVKLTQQP